MPGVKDQVNGADFNRRIQIQKDTLTDDGQGGQTSGGWATIYTCWANIENPPRGKGLHRSYMFQQLYPQMTTIIQIRFQKTTSIDATMRILYTAHSVNHIYQIDGIENPGEANVSMWILCHENQAQAVN